MLKVNGIDPSSLMDGEGIRYTIFFQGCEHHCKGCHSPHTWDINQYNIAMSPEDLILDIKKYKKYITGITLSGGDPLFQIREVYEFLKIFRADKELEDLNVWLYTGYEFEEIPSPFLSLIDVVKSGKYIKELPSKLWCGSNNQRIHRKITGLIHANRWKED